MVSTKLAHLCGWLEWLCAAALGPHDRHQSPFIDGNVARPRGSYELHGSKKPKVTIVAVMRKMITTLNAIVRDDVLWADRHSGRHSVTTTR